MRVEYPKIWSIDLIQRTIRAGWFSLELIVKLYKMNLNLKWKIGKSISFVKIEIAKSYKSEYEIEKKLISICEIEN